MNTAEPTYLTHRQILIVISGLMVGMFLSALDQNIVGTALPQITSDLGGMDKLSWVVTAYMLTATASTPLWGKISDIFGRRPLFQLAIIAFVLGSVIAGFSNTMPQLIASRAIQGLGGGGLMALAMAIVGDIIPPRERGRYQGLFAMVFGTSSVLGPILGGWFADPSGPGWRWMFFINVPLGIIALFITSSALKMPHTRRDHKIDYLGAALLVASVSSLLLYISWASHELGWFHQTSVLLLVGGILGTLIFILVELRATEPILPMSLFKNSIFSISNLFGFIIGIAMFGAMVFMSLYLQVAQGMSPRDSGLAMIPMVVGIFSTSIAMGQIMSRTGKYKFIPPTGAFIVGVALFMLSRLTPETAYWQVGFSMYVMGAGLGMTMQVLIVIVQNSVSRENLGVASSSVAFFRQMGGTFGTAIFGSILNSRLVHYLAEGGFTQAGGKAIDATNVAAINQLPSAAKNIVKASYSNSLHDMYLFAIPAVAIAFLIALFIKEIPLAQREIPEPTQSVA